LNLDNLKVTEVEAQLEICFAQCGSAKKNYVRSLKKMKEGGWVVHRNHNKLCSREPEVA
jgi:hypothetical protein